MSTEYTFPGICLGRHCASRKRKDYNCNGFVSLIVGGAKAKLKEFPHMAGEVRVIKMFLIEIRLNFF